MIDIKDLQQQPEGQLFDRMFREMAEAGNPAPEYKQVEFMVKVRLNSALREEAKEGTTELTMKKNGEKSVLENKMQLSERQKGILQRMKETGKRNVLENVLETSSSLAEYFAVNERTIRRDLQYLQKQGIIRRVGPDKGGHWEVVEQNEKGGK